MYFMLLMSLAFFVGVVGVACNPSPCFGALALVLASGFGCAMVAEMGSSFSALILFLIYLGGMLVVFAYSVAMSGDVYPEAWNGGIFGFMIVCFVGLIFIIGKFLGLVSFGVHGLGLSHIGVSLLYSYGGYYLLFVGFGLLLALFVVLELVRWISFGAYKA
uniref:NADH dehydrogenase subunit 6 n=1 Tax=Phrynocephalus helioscopus varius TaxID=1104164 RepID=UPI001F138B91|nr:NADH dehydrogenase subunit 6 [Phrynocephalus helioscopus varius]UMB51119.1 NADH dehydrogenase subunit 6 [Phrynocephalus helioscopus varius]